MYNIMLQRNYCAGQVAAEMLEQFIAKYRAEGYDVAVFHDELILTRKKEDEE